MTTTKMKESDISRGILSDSDSRYLMDDELQEFKPVPEGGENEKD
ncbi:hypothetical protein [Marinomonas spartinae]|nr:hypothetical protein [Marinomonas spartinae]